MSSTPGPSPVEKGGRIFWGGWVSWAGDLPPPKKPVYSGAMQVRLFLVPLLAGLVACAQGDSWIFWGKGVSWASVPTTPGLAGAKPVPSSTRRGIWELSFIMVWC